MTRLPFAAYVICTSPRSGSTLLCEMLKATAVAGQPGSHFHAPSLARWLEVYGLEAGSFGDQTAALRAVFAAARTRGMGDSAIFGLRLQHGSFAYFLEQAARLHPGAKSDHALIEAAFGPTLFIHLSRGDKLAQAISRLVAEQSGLWHRRADGTELERLAPARDPVYDRAAIAAHLEDLQRMDAAWETWFAREAIAPLRISYDDLAGDPQGEVVRVLEALRLDPAHAAHGLPPTARLADGRNRDWAAWFRADGGV